MNPSTTAYLNFQRDNQNRWGWRAYSDRGEMYGENNGHTDLPDAMEDAIQWILQTPDADNVTRPAPRRRKRRAKA